MKSPPFTINYNTLWTINNYYKTENAPKEYAKPRKTSKSLIMAEKKLFFQKKQEENLNFSDIEEISPQTTQVKASLFVGYGLIIIVFFFFCWFSLNFFGVLLRKNSESHIILEDGYYCLLFPLTLPISILIAYGNWLAGKFFRHN